MSAICSIQKWTIGRFGKRLEPIAVKGGPLQVFPSPLCQENKRFDYIFIINMLRFLLKQMVFLSFIQSDKCSFSCPSHISDSFFLTFIYIDMA